MASIFDKLHTFGDYQRENEKFELEKQKILQAKTGATPAAMQMADSYIKNIESTGKVVSPLEKNNILTNFAKTVERGLIQDTNGNYISAPGYDQSLAARKGLASAADEQAKQIQKSIYEPTREENIANRKANVDLEYKPRITSANEKAKVDTEKQVDLGERAASIPQLEKTVAQLSALGKGATYTTTGKVADFLYKESAPLRQSIFGSKTPAATEGAVKRSEYTSLVDNQVLPLLRQTFGAAFTKAEGDSLKVTLGDPDLPPEQKDAVLRSFMDQKKQTINTKERELGLPLTDWTNVNIGNDNLGTPMGGNPTPAELAAGKADKFQASKKREETIFTMKKNNVSQQEIDEYLKQKGL